MKKINNDDDSILFTEFKVSTAESDMYERIRLGALINYFIQSAINSADNLGFGFENLVEQRLFWVLSRFTVEIYRPLKRNEEVIVETWPKDINGILYIRDFIIRDKGNKIVSKATSGWLAINSQTKRPNRLADSISVDNLTRLKDKHGLKDAPEKLNDVAKGDKFEVIAKYFDIDLNKHVTSTRYFDWLMDTFTPEFHKKFYPKKVSINYLKETKPEEKLAIVRETVSDNLFLFEGTNLNNESKAFRGKIEF